MVDKYKNKISEKVLAHMLMILLVIAWGFDFVPAKWALELLSPSAVTFFKYAIGLVFVLILKLVSGNRNLVRKKDIPLFLLCALVGQVMYFQCEYNAMSYLPVALITIILSFVPAVSILAERVIFGRKANAKIYCGIVLCIVGIVLVIGADFGILFQGRGIGYLLAVGAVISWNVYNFITAALGEYDGLTLSVTQMLCSSLILLPMAIPTMPSLTEFSGRIIFGLLWIGLIDSGIGYLIMVYGIKILGPTTAAIYSNFMPVTTAFFGVVILGETITWLQIAGGIVVIVAGYIVIKEKGMLDEKQKQADSERKG